jgi:ketosteroid isomerase-like protein
MRVQVGRWLAVVLFLVVAVGILPAQSSELMNADIAFCEATRERGLDGWMSFFADDAYKGEPLVQGREALRKVYSDLFTPRELDFRWTPAHSEIFPSGELGYTSGRYTYAFTDKNGVRMRRTGSYLTVWRKQADGSWKVLTDIGSADKHPAQQDAVQPKKQ